MKSKSTKIDTKQDWTNRIVALLHEQVYESVPDGEALSFEMVQERLASTLNGAGHAFELQELESRKATEMEIEIDGKRYRRLKQPSSETYFGLYGSYRIEEPLYRRLGVHNGPTVRVLAMRIGSVTKNMTPRLARITGEMSADLTSREIHRLLKSLGFSPPSRSYIEKHLKGMATELASVAATLEREAQATEELPDGIASLSCGLDRKAVPMEEPLPEGVAPKPLKRPRQKPYQRKPPAPIEINYRMAFVGSVTAYNSTGDALKTWRYATDAGANVNEFASRLISQIATLIEDRPEIPIVVVQDAAKELRVLPEQVREVAANNNVVHQRVDFIHLMDYLTNVVRTCEPEGDPRNMLDWYRHELLRDDDAIDRIYQSLLRKLNKLAPSLDAYKAVEAALSYIKDRRSMMRYAGLYAQNLPIGSGATESTCKLMGQRANRSGMRWHEPGLRGIFTLRGLVLSEQWHLAWRSYADAKCAIVLPCAPSG